MSCLLFHPFVVVEKPPYEVTETGWGEFEIQIRIYFVDVNEKPVSFIRFFGGKGMGRDLILFQNYDHEAISSSKVALINEKFNEK